MRNTRVLRGLDPGRISPWGNGRACGCSSADALASAGREARTLGLAQPCAVQLPYSLARTDWVEDPAMERALADTGASLIPSAVLAGGALSGKYAEGQTGRLSGELDAAALRRAFELGAALREPAQRQGVSPATLAIAFTLRHPRTAATLIGATRSEQIDEALSAVELAMRLTDDEVARLRELAR